MTSELMQHPRVIVEVLAAYWLFSAIVTSMPRPSPESYWGTWIYGALHLFAGSVKAFADSKIQSLSTTTTTVKTVEPVPPAVPAAPDKVQ